MTNNKQFDMYDLRGNWATREGKIAILPQLNKILEEFLDTQRSELISQIKGIGCEEGVDLVTVARIINKLNGVVYKAIIK
jgi:hypothetical protein